MLANETIIKLAAKMQTSELNVRREYFQHLFLSIFYQQAGMDKVYFKGGTALRLVYSSPRFSEDLDFDSPLADIGQIENAIIATLDEAQKDGVEVELDEAKETSGGYLSTMRFSALGNVVPIRIEVSFRNPKSQGTATLIGSDLFPEYTIMQLAERELVRGKINALLDRQKPRDFYDFYFLLRSRLLSEKSRETFEAVLKALQASSIRFDAELKVFLPKSQHMIIRDFKAVLTRELKRYI